MPSSVQISLPLDLRPYHNQRLFADHYLEDHQRLRAMSDWQQATGVEDAFHKIHQLYTQRAVHFTSHTNEAQTEQDFIRPVLDLLWGSERYQVQVRIPNVDVQQQPDYAFFRTAEARQAAQPRHGTLEYWHEVPCLGDAKRWTASLDKERGVTENPSNQISNYLYRSGVRWGILTNGRIWRLYEREKSRAGGIYYEVHLEQLLQSGNLEGFKYFYLFFRRDAFLPDRSGVIFVEKVFQGSIDYAAEVGDKLKESVYDALHHLMNGFFAYPGNGLDAHDPAMMRLVHENSLILLYRLLFILYAEDRGLLPCDDEPYANYSLACLHRQINQQLREDHRYLPNMTGLWHHLLNLFQLIDTGFPEGGIPAYNGGLFSPARYPHIAHTPQPHVTQWQLDDRHCAEVINLLAYERDHWDEAGVRDVDYATLAVQHLGSIYEGLLELQPRIADEAMVEVTEDGKPVFKPAREVPNPRPIRGQPPRRINAGEVYLVTNRGERKATGSYYTPKYIVDYIVEHTIGVLADDAARQVTELRPAVEREIQTSERQRQEWERVARKKSFPDGSLHDSEKQIAQLNTLIEHQKRRLLEPYLSLNILDPAMGSGHFLVGAADHLSLAMATDPNVLPLEDMEDEDPQMFYKRLVVERCLYGVDLNPLAVELAKLSLWLHTVSQDKALSFLDHHLRCGNSLIGAQVEDDLMKEPPRFNARGKRLNADKPQLVFGFTSALTATHLQHFLDTFREIMETPTGDAETERKKDRLYRDMDAVRDKFRAVANCWLAPFFGVPVTPEQYERAVNTLRGTDAEWHALTQETWFAHAQQVARDKRFFHWELEFPEIFCNAHGLKPEEERGFGAVIGNPPYIVYVQKAKGRISDFVIYQEVPSLEMTYYIERFRNSAEYAPNTFALFTENSIILAQCNAYQAFIYPSSLLYYFYFKRVRHFLTTECTLRHIIQIAHVFEEAETGGNTIVVCQKITPKDERGQTLIGEAATAERLSALQEEVVAQQTFADLPNTLWITDIRRLQAVKQIQANSVFLGSLGRFYQGVCTGNNAKYMVADNKHPLCEKVLRGRDINCYEADYAGLYLIFDKAAMWSNTDESFLRAPKKVLIRQTGDSIVATYDDDGYFIIDSLYLFVLSQTCACDLRFILALLNSRVLTFYYRFLCPEEDRAFAQVKIVNLEPLPIRRITFTTPPDERARLVEEGKRLYHQMLEEIANHR